MPVEIPVVNDSPVIVDVIDGDLSLFKWYAQRRNTRVYAYRFDEDGKQRRMTADIAERLRGKPLQPGEQVRHLNGDPRDNRRGNLKIVGKLPKGITRVVDRDLYKVQRWMNGKTVYLGYAPTLKEARKLYREGVKRGNPA